MKKTLTLLSCIICPFATAALSDNQLNNPTSITISQTAASVNMTSILSQNSTSQSFTAVMDMDVEALSVFTVGNSTLDAKKTPIISWTIGDNAHTCNISVNNNSENNSITIAGFYYEYADNAACAIPTDKSAATGKFTTNGDGAVAALSAIDWAKAESAVLTLTYNGLSANTGPLGTQIYFSVKMDDGTITTLQAAVESLRWTSPGNNVTAIGYDPTYLNGLTIYEGFATAEQAWNLNNTALVPEPTTATLSLLALVGLAARRRRK